MAIGNMSKVYYKTNENEKAKDCLQVAAQIFSIDPARIKVNSTNTYRIANTSPSAASATADLNGKATLMACEKIVERLKEVAAKQLNVAANTISFKDEKICVNGIP